MYPSPLKPRSQSQLKPPGVLVQRASVLQLCPLVMHSFMSGNKINAVDSQAGHNIFVVGDSNGVLFMWHRYLPLNIASDSERNNSFCGLSFIY